MSQRKKIKTEDKVRIAKAWINGDVSLNAAAKQLGVHPSVVDDWVRLYQTEGVGSFLPRKENRRYDPTLKEAAVKDYLSGRGSIREICKIYKIRSTRQLRDWIKVYNGHKDFKKQTGGSRMTKGRETRGCFVYCPILLVRFKLGRGVFICCMLSKSMYHMGKIEASAGWFAVLSVGIQIR